MRPYVTDYISPKERNLFKKIKDAVNRMDDPFLEKEIILSCHVLTRAVHNIFLLEVEDGYFADYYQHSWLRTKNGHFVDVYPVACLGGPIMIDGGNASPARKLYRKAPLNGLSILSHEVSLVTEALWEAYKKERKEIGIPL